MSVNSFNLSDSISESLFGLLLCDSLEAAVEGQSPESFDQAKTLRRGGKFQLKPGQFTDDGSTALCLAIALLGSETDNAVIHPSTVQMNLYRRWYESGYLSSTGECFDIAKSDKLSSADASYYGSASSHASGNGSLMRLASAPLLYQRDPLNAMNESINSSETMHAWQLCLDSCRVYTGLIIGALQGATKEELLNSDQLYVPAGLSHDY
ncbi:unnamed protein product [Rotaria socialis]